MGRKLQKKTRTNQIKKQVKKNFDGHRQRSQSDLAVGKISSDVNLKAPESIAHQAVELKPRGSVKGSSAQVASPSVKPNISEGESVWSDEMTREDLPELSDDAKLFHAALEQFDLLAIMEKKASDPHERIDRSSSGFMDRTISLRQSKVSKKNKNLKQVEIDLHGLILIEAQHRVEFLIEDLKGKSGKVELTIVTGKGIGSSGRPVLAGEIWRFVKERYGPYLSYLDSNPMETVLGGLPMRGYFRVIFQF